MKLMYAKSAAVVATVIGLQFTSCSSGSSGTTTYAVSGTVEGLGENDSIVIQLNDGGGMTINADGTFTFSEKLPMGMQYTVSVVSGPCDSITVQNGNGTVEGNVNNVSIVCTRWRHPSSPTDKLSPIGSDADDGSIAINASGDMLVAFEQYNDADLRQIFIAEYRNGQWTRPTDLTDFISIADDRATDVAVALSDNGDAIIAYEQDAGPEDRIYVSHRRQGAWTHPTTFSDNISVSGEQARSPKVTMFPNGEAIVAWEQRDGSHYQVFKSEYRSGTWTHPTGLTDNVSPDGHNVEDLEIASSPNGDAALVYLAWQSPNYRVMLSELRNGSWTHATSINDTISLSSSSATIARAAFAANGDTVVAWRQSDGSNPQVFKAEYRSGAWSYPANPADNISPAGQSVVQLDVAMAPNGDALIVWEQYDGNVDAVFRSELRNGTWTHPSSLTDNITSDLVYCEQPQVAMSNAAAVIVFRREYGSYDSVYMTDYRNGAWRDDVRIAPPLTDVWDPRVVMNASGQALAQWTAWSNSIDGIYASYYR